MSSIGTIVELLYFTVKAAGIEPGVVSLDHRTVVRFLEDLFDSLDDEL
jgi:hypothetical protein